MEDAGSLITHKLFLFCCHQHVGEVKAIGLDNNLLLFEVKGEVVCESDDAFSQSHRNEWDELSVVNEVIVDVQIMAKLMDWDHRAHDNVIEMRNQLSNKELLQLIHAC